MLFGKLFTGFGRLTDLLAYDLPFVVLVVLNGIKQRRFLRAWSVF